MTKWHNLLTVLQYTVDIILHNYIFSASISELDRWGGPTRGSSDRILEERDTLRTVAKGRDTYMYHTSV